MSGIGFSEFLILCMIGLIVLGPTRLPKVASQIGTWIGQARRMTRVMKRQLEEEIDFDTGLSVKPFATPATSNEADHPAPLDDDTYSPVHGHGTPGIESADAPEAPHTSDVLGDASLADTPVADDPVSGKAPKDSGSDERRDT